MAAPLKLEVVMSMVDKALAPLRGIDRQAKATAEGLKAARETTAGLNKQLADIRGYHRMSKESRSLSADQTALQNKLQAANRRVEEQRATLSNLAASVKVARAEHQRLVQGYQDGGIESGSYIRQMELSRITLLRVTQAQEKASSGLRREKEAVRGAEQEMAQLQRRQAEITASLRGYKGRLDEAGIGTDGLARKLRQIQQQWKSGTAEVNRQREAMARMAEQQRKMAAIKDAHGRAMASTAAMAGAGVAGVVTGATVARPVRASLGAYGEQENASTQLRASMMQADGSVPKDFERITELATRLGDRLPGTTAEFQEMMTMLRRQGLSAQSILGGTGEAAALLGVQLRMPVTEAAEFAAKMQDATRTTEGDMLGLMDTIQRTFYLGVDSGNMLQGFTKMSPVMGILKKEGLEASNMLAPLLVMMDQTGMAGESAGNAIRKVFQGGFDEKKLAKANDLLKGAKAGFKLDFTDGKGEFGGIEQMFAQLKRLEKLNTTQRTSVIKQLFGDDSETLQVIDTFMSKGLAGYNEVVAKMQAQADLRKRVDMQLGTLSNVVEAAQGTWTNVLAAIGETVAPDAKNLVNWLGDTASAVGAWVKANPQLVAWLAKIAAAVAVLYVAIGGLMLGLAGVLGPMLVVRFALQAIGVQGGLLAVVLRGAAGAVRLLGAAVVGVLRLLLAHPIVAIVAGIALAAFMVYRHWGAITGFFARLWESVKATAAGAWQGIAGALAAAWQGVQSTAASVWQQLGGSFPAVLMTITAAIVNWSPLGLFYQAFAGVLGFFGIQLPQRFTEFGTYLVQGLISGIQSMLGAVRTAMGALGRALVGKFTGDMQIHSPSRVFRAAGVNVGEGAALGINDTHAMVRRAAAGMAAAAAVALPMPAFATPPQLPEVVQRVARATPHAAAPEGYAADAAAPWGRAPELAAVQPLAPIDRRPPLMAAPAARPAPAPAAPAAGDRIEIHIHAAPGMDTRAVAAAVRAELERRDAEKRNRAGGGFYDYTN